MKNKIIWVVDDDSIFQIIIRKIIEKSGLFSVISLFPNGKEAIIALKDAVNQNQQLPDLILLDINMPIMDGWEFMDEMVLMESELIKKIIISISSSSISEEDKEKAKTYSSIVSYLSKPITVEDLQMVSKFL